MFISLNIVENIFANSLSAEHNNPITINAIIPVKHTALKILFFSFFSPICSSFSLGLNSFNTALITSPI